MLNKFLFTNDKTTTMNASKRNCWEAFIQPKTKCTINYHLVRKLTFVHVIFLSVFIIFLKILLLYLLFLFYLLFYSIYLYFFYLLFFFYSFYCLRHDLTRSRHIICQYRCFWVTKTCYKHWSYDYISPNDTKARKLHWR